MVWKCGGAYGKSEERGSMRVSSKQDFQPAFYVDQGGGKGCMQLGLRRRRGVCRGDFTRQDNAIVLLKQR